MVGLLLCACPRRPICQSVFSSRIHSFGVLDVARCRLESKLPDIYISGVLLRRLQHLCQGRPRAAILEEFGRANASTDIYSLAKVLIEMLKLPDGSATKRKRNESPDGIWIEIGLKAKMETHEGDKSSHRCRNRTRPVLESYLLGRRHCSDPFLVYDG
jgi:hypothetical protein